MQRHRPPEVMAAGMGLVPEDRQQPGLVMEMTVMGNATLTVLRQMQRFGLVSRAKERAIAGLAGTLWLARFGTVDAMAAEGIELTVITSTVVGGVAK